MEKSMLIIIAAFVLILNFSLATSKDVIPRPPECGRTINRRIYIGNDTDIDDYPWVAQIQYTKSDGSIIHICIGSLISSRYVMTAGYCADEKTFPSDHRLTGVRLGDWNLDTNPDCVNFDDTKDCAPEYIDVPVESINLHPEFDKRQMKNDIALLRLVRTIEFNDFVSPICLPVPTHLRNVKYDGKMMSVSGWDRRTKNPIKYNIVATGQSLEKCVSAYDNSRFKLEDSHLCTTCVSGVGAGGGPLMDIDNSNPKLHYLYIVGIVSFGPGSCTTENFDVYTRVGHFMDWIQETIQE